MATPTVCSYEITAYAGNGNLWTDLALGRVSLFATTNGPSSGGQSYISVYTTSLPGN